MLVTDPVLSGDIPDTSDWYIRDLERLQVRLCLVVPDLDLSIAARQPSR